MGCIAFSRGSSGPRDQTQVFFSVGRFFTIWATSINYTPIKNNLKKIQPVKLKHIHITSPSGLCRVPPLLAWDWALSRVTSLPSRERTQLAPRMVKRVNLSAPHPPPADSYLSWHLILKAQQAQSDCKSLPVGATHGPGKYHRAGLGPCHVNEDLTSLRKGSWRPGGCPLVPFRGPSAHWGQ